MGAERSSQRRHDSQRQGIVEATSDYERWLGARAVLLDEQLVVKHTQMAQDPFRFLRATFYRWLQHWQREAQELTRAVSVVSVGDLHVEDFGTWRDAEGRLIWGINDFDEACLLPWTHDLVRLVTSARIATEVGCLSIRTAAASESVLEGYNAALQARGQPFVLARENQFLRDVTADARNPRQFWAKLEAFETATEVPRAAVQALKKALPEPRMKFRTVSRLSGLGSLGRQRFVVIAQWAGGEIAREAKCLAAPAYGWAQGAKEPRKSFTQVLLDEAVRSRDPFVEFVGQWFVRRLAPDCVRVDWKKLGNKRDERKLLRAMGYELGNVHLANDSAALIGKDARFSDARWLAQAAKHFVELTLEDWSVWRKHVLDARRAPS